MILGSVFKVCSCSDFFVNIVLVVVIIIMVVRIVNFGMVSCWREYGDEVEEGSH